MAAISEIASRFVWKRNGTHSRSQRRLVCRQWAKTKQIISINHLQLILINYSNILFNNVQTWRCRVDNGLSTDAYSWELWQASLSVELVSVSWSTRGGGGGGALFASPFRNILPWLQLSHFLQYIFSVLPGFHHAFFHRNHQREACSICRGWMEQRFHAEEKLLMH